MRKLKSHNTPFVKFGAGNTPLHTSYNPTVFACLWPTLFPYSVGAFEDGICLNKALGFRHINMKPHVSHLLSLSEPRFQKHISFIFLMMNINQRKKTLFNPNLHLSSPGSPRSQKVWQE